VTPSPIRVLVVDDQTMVREGLRMILEAQSDIEVVGEAGDGAAALRETAAHRPDVVLMDIRMPGMDGLAATERLMRAGSAARVLVLTTFGHDEYLYAAMRAGASGFLLKDSPRAQLLHAVRTVAEGASLLDPALTRRLIEDWVRRPPPATGVPEVLRRLTPRELEVFGALARGRSNAEIAAALVLSETTVKSHVAHVLDKLALRDRVQAVVLGYECGLLRPGEGGAVPAR
jgi:DNA-binding NarL/FixJ family response regulator